MASMTTPPPQQPIQKAPRVQLQDQDFLRHMDFHPSYRLGFCYVGITVIVLAQLFSVGTTIKSAIDIGHFMDPNMVSGPIGFFVAGIVGLMISLGSKALPKLKLFQTNPKAAYKQKQQMKSYGITDIKTELPYEGRLAKLTMLGQDNFSVISIVIDVVTDIVALMSLFTSGFTYFQPIPFLASLAAALALTAFLFSSLYLFLPFVFSQYVEAKRDLVMLRIAQSNEDAALIQENLEIEHKKSGSLEKYMRASAQTYKSKKDIEADAGVSIEEILTSQKMFKKKMGY